MKQFSSILWLILALFIFPDMLHGFDDQGCKYNELGNLSNWWTNEDRTKFTQKTKMIVKQFNDYVAVDNLHINGELTQGENIADLGGVVMEPRRMGIQYRSSGKCPIWKLHRCLFQGTRKSVF